MKPILYWKYINIVPSKPFDENRDRLILSKGHAAMALYACIADKGFINKSELETFNCDNGRLAEHPPAGLIHGIEAGSGSLPTKNINSYAISIKSTIKAKEVSTLFRNASTSIVGYIHKGTYFIDLKAISNDQANIVSKIITEVLS